MATSKSPAPAIDKPKNESDEILRVCSYHRSEFDTCLVRSHPRKLNEVSTCLQTAFDGPSSLDPDILARLSPESTTNILLQLDIKSYLTFRQVNRRARHVATNLHEYKLIAAHGLEGLKGLIRMKLVDKFTIRDLYLPLVNYKCAVCGDFGGCLFLLTCTRCCFSCINSSPELRVRPEFNTSPEHTAYNQNTWNGHITMVLGILDSLGGTMHVNHTLKPTTSAGTTQLVSLCLAILEMRHKSRSLPQLENTLMEQVDSQANRFASATAFPWYDLDTGRVERGVSCRGCHVRFDVLGAGNPQVLKDSDRLFSCGGFLEHFESCTYLQNYWRDIKGGKMADLSQGWPAPVMSK
ncbi:F-box domain Skp2 [Fusarium albosuccineum]|uniref:F-box domain Skp2 n=1 Tax=Fusarium albosuccineum TaxID=1237068 RepID=A0A8H4PEM2_9HYPO|nr:F-box domain Skp2 [Fusarium albosuccineum]